MGQPEVGGTLIIYANLVFCKGREEPYEVRVSRTVLRCRVCVVGDVVSEIE